MRLPSLGISYFEFIFIELTNFNLILKMTYSTDLRRKVLSIKEQENLTTTEVAKRFGIGTANVSRWNKKNVLAINLRPKLIWKR